MRQSRSLLLFVHTRYHSGDRRLRTRIQIDFSLFRKRLHLDLFVILYYMVKCSIAQQEIWTFIISKKFDFDFLSTPKKVLTVAAHDKFRPHSNTLAQSLCTCERNHVERRDVTCLRHVSHSRSVRRAICSPFEHAFLVNEIQVRSMHRCSLHPGKCSSEGTSESSRVHHYQPIGIGHSTPDYSLLRVYELLKKDSWIIYQHDFQII